MATAVTKGASVMKGLVLGLVMTVKARGGMVKGRGGYSQDPTRCGQRQESSQTPGGVWVYAGALFSRGGITTRS